MKINLQNIEKFVGTTELSEMMPYANGANAMLHEKTGKGNDFLGWVDLPNAITQDFLADINQTAEKLKNQSDIVVVIGIGGSYLGAKSIIEALADNFSAYKKTDNPHVVFAGQNISEDYHSELRDLLKDHDYSLIVISKSGTTTEPAIAFRLLKSDLEAKYGAQAAKDRIVAITDAEKGALRTLADKQGYKTYIVPDDVGGRYSVLTPVGLLPVAVAGFDINAMVAGAVSMYNETEDKPGALKNPATKYAAARSLLYQKGKKIEILVNYEPKLQYFTEWWKQLYGESEGKEGKGIFPAGVNFSADLHSMGQYIQDGERTLFETIISVKESDNVLKVPLADSDLDGLNYLAGKRISYVNHMAERGTALAHLDGNVPLINIEIEKIDEYNLGRMVYFFEKACGISGYVLKVNPFDQPGVEAYKKNMFALLGKPGFEALKKELESR